MGRFPRASIVSILVFLEPLLRPSTIVGVPAVPNRFQSLFFWNHCLDFSYNEDMIQLIPVSILVFLEPLLRRGLSDGN